MGVTASNRNDPLNETILQNFLISQLNLAFQLESDNFLHPNTHCAVAISRTNPSPIVIPYNNMLTTWGYMIRWAHFPNYVQLHPFCLSWRRRLSLLTNNDRVTALWLAICRIISSPNIQRPVWEAYCHRLNLHAYSAVTAISRYHHVGILQHFNEYFSLQMNLYCNRSISERFEESYLIFISKSMILFPKLWHDMIFPVCHSTCSV